MLGKLLRLLRILNLRRPTIPDINAAASRTEFALVLPVGIRDFHLLWEISVAAMGGYTQRLAEGTEADLKPKLLRISIAALAAAISGALWHLLWDPWRESYFADQTWILPSPSTSTTTTPPPPLLWMRIKFLITLSALSGSWVAVAVFSSISSTTPTF